MKNLELNQMEMTYGGADILKDGEACSEFALGVSGAAVMIGVASWWTGVGAGAAAIMSIGSFALSAYCDTL